jgi:4-hydroxybenzoate polyprenyltransferase
MKLTKNINIKPAHLNKLNSYIKITRPEGLPYEFSMPLFGSYLATKSLSVLINPYVILIGIISSLIASNSMVINDYYDYKSGTDNAKTLKVLNNNELTTEEVLYYSMYLAIASYYLTSFINNYVVRNIISNTILLTYLYTPIFKKIPLIKNAVVALIISQAPITGALIVNGNIQNIIPVTLYLFNLIMWQEIILDILDTEGDKKNNIKTLPVLYGHGTSNKLALIFLLLGTLLPYGFSIKFTLLQLPLIVINIYAIKNNKILKKTALKISKIVMLISGFYMCY